MEKRELLIDLQNAHVTQLTDSEGVKSPWLVRQNETNDDLYKLPGHWKEEDVFTALDFAREFELTALNAGIRYGNRMSVDAFTIEKNNLLKVIEGLTDSNTRLAEKLGKFIGEEE